MNAYELNQERKKLTHDEINSLIETMIKTSGMTRRNNGFFSMASKPIKVPVESAYKVAYHWRAFTRQFVLTSLVGVGSLAQQTLQSKVIPDAYLLALQSSVNIVTDDLYNASSIFEKAPQGVGGIHYRWWEDTILFPLEKLLKSQNKATEVSLGKKTKHLLSVMARQATSHLGIAVQLRIIEAIALEVCIAFRGIYSRLELDGHAIFSRDNLQWILTHIKAEISHNEQVNNSDNGILMTALDIQEQDQLLAFADEYVQAYRGFLDELKDILLEGRLIQLEKPHHKRWQCLVCDFIYDESLGMPEDNIPPGTSWDAIPDDWMCPDCGVKKSDFEMIELSY